MANKAEVLAKADKVLDPFNGGLLNESQAARVVKRLITPVPYRLSIYPALDLPGGNKCYHTEIFYSKAGVFAAKHTAANLLLFLQDQAKLMPDYSNLCIVEVQDEEGEWQEVEEE